MNKSRKFLGVLGVVGVVVPSLVTLSCKSQKQTITTVDSEIKLKSNKFLAKALGFEGTAQQVINEKLINQKWILEKLTILFDNIDVNKIVESDIIIAYAKATGTSLSIGLKIKDKPFTIEINDFKQEEQAVKTELRSGGKFQAKELFGNNNDEELNLTVSQAKTQITKEWIKEKSVLIFSQITKENLDKITGVQVKEIGTTIFVTLVGLDELVLEISGFKEETQDSPTDKPEVVIKQNIDLDAATFSDLKDRTINGINNSIITEGWLHKNQNAIFQSSNKLQLSDIKIKNQGQDKNSHTEYRVYATVLNKDVLITISNFKKDVVLKQQTFNSAELQFNPDLKPSEVISSINKNQIFTYKDVLFNIYSSDLVLEDIESVSAKVVNDTIEVIVKIWNKELKLTITGFKNKYVDAKKTEFNIQTLNTPKKNSQLEFLDLINSDKGKHFIYENKDTLFEAFGLSSSDNITVISSGIKWQLLDNGYIELTVKFVKGNDDNIVDTVKFKVFGFNKIDATYIKNVQATAIRVGSSTSQRFKYKFVITGSNLPTIRFVQNFRVKHVWKNNNGTYGYTDTYRNYWGYVKGVKHTSERIELEITRDGVWKPGHMMLIHRAGRHMNEGFLLTLPY